MPTDPQFWIGVFALLVAVYTAYLQRKQLMLAPATKRGGAKLVPKSWWQYPPLLATFAMALLVWVPWAISYFNRAPAPTIGIGGWGTQNAAGGLPITVVMIKEDPTIRLIGIAYHYDGFGDVFDAKGLQKSAPYDVRIGSIIILIKPDAEFLNEVTSGKHVRTNYVLISIPASLGDNPNFSTLRQATALGAKVLWTGIGPP